MYNLRILFTCLCAHVIRKDDALVILPDARFGCPPMKGPQETGHPQGRGHSRMVSSHTGKAHHVMPPHVGAIQFDPDDLVSGDRLLKPHMTYRGPDSRQESALYFLSGQDIVLDGERTGRPVLSDGRTEGSEIPENAIEEADLSWVAEVSKVDEAAGYVDPDCAQPGSSAPLDGRPRVLARMRLTDGRISSAIVAREERGRPFRFSWIDLETKSRLGKYDQALSAAVAYDLPVAGNHVALGLRDFGKRETQWLRFSLAGRPFGYTLQLAIKNMPLESLLEVERAIDPVKPDTVDEHFAMYYALSDTPPDKLWVPVKDGSRSGAPICPSSRFVQRPDWA